MPTRRVPRPAPKKPRAKKPKPEPVATNDARPLAWITAVVDSETLTRDEKRVLWAYVRYADGATGGSVHPGDELIAGKLLVSVDTVKRNRRSGTAKGYLRLVRKGHGVKRWAAVYQLTIPKVPTVQDGSQGGTDAPLDDDP